MMPPAALIDGLLEITIHGRGGQGAQVAAQTLAGAFFRSGREVQAFAAYGGERRGAPVTAYVRVAVEPIHLRADIDRAGHVLVLDASLLAGLRPESLRDDALVIVNSPAAPCGFMAAGSRMVAIDAAAIAERQGLGAIVSTAVLGAFAAATGLVTLDDLLAAIEEWCPVKKAQNVSACRRGYETVAAVEPVGH